MAQGNEIRKPATVTIWDKHNAPSKWNKLAIKKTENNEARFKPGVNVTALASLYFDPTKSHAIDQRNFYAKMPHVIGASNGEETK